MKCKICGHKFTPTRFLQKTCLNVDCMTQWGLSQIEKERSRQKIAFKKKFKESDTTTLKQTAQKVFNDYIRLRDRGKPCISCGSMNTQKGHASHFFSVGAHNGLRFHEWNVHLACVKCNVFLHGNLDNYKPRLIEKIGLERFNGLESIRFEAKKFSSEYLKKVIRVYRKKIAKVTHRGAMI